MITTELRLETWSQDLVRTQPRFLKTLDNRSYPTIQLLVPPATYPLRSEIIITLAGQRLSHLSAVLILPHQGTAKHTLDRGQQPRRPVSTFRQGSSRRRQARRHDDTIQVFLTRRCTLHQQAGVCQPLDEMISIRAELFLPRCSASQVQVQVAQSVSKDALQWFTGQSFVKIVWNLVRIRVVSHVARQLHVAFVTMMIPSCIRARGSPIARRE